MVKSLGGYVLFLIAFILTVKIICFIVFLMIYSKEAYEQFKIERKIYEKIRSFKKIEEDR